MLEVNGTEPALQLPLYVCGCVCVWLRMRRGPRRPEADICVRPVTLLPAVSLIFFARVQTHISMNIQTSADVLGLFLHKHN